jgi:alanyl-tRNA synthetase
MTAQEIRKKYLEFFAGKGHKVLPRALLVPQDDPTTLFTGSGMQALIPYLLGEEHPEGKRLTDSQPVSVQTTWTKLATTATPHFLKC